MLKSKYLARILGAVLLITLSSCCYTSEEQLNCIEMGMSPRDLSNVMHEPSGHKGGSTIAEDGKSYEAWEYKVGSLEKPYYFYFHDNKLVKWGQPQDWNNTPKATLDINTKSDIKIEK
ncbi:MAG: hypothetical protein K1000chlam1_01244 [Candidatus Anoxychlamydiales bacterium]|nr:hypothetical protein [Candidatus Anoxychlamydiales bacterium]